jgi:hypothetical protein
MSISEATELTLATLRGSFPPVDPDFGFHRRTGGDTGRSINGVFVQERWLPAPAGTAPTAWPGTAASSSSTARHGTNGGTYPSSSPAPPTAGSWPTPVPTAHGLPCPAAARAASRPAPPAVPHAAACRNRPPDVQPHTRDICGYRLDTAPAVEPAIGLNLDPVLHLQKHLLHAAPSGGLP